MSDEKAPYIYNLRMTAAELLQLIGDGPHGSLVTVATVELPSWVQAQCPGNLSRRQPCADRQTVGRPNLQPCCKVGLRRMTGALPAVIREQPMCSKCRHKPKETP